MYPNFVTSPYYALIRLWFIALPRVKPISVALTSSLRLTVRRLRDAAQRFIINVFSDFPAGVTVVRALLTARAGRAETQRLPWLLAS
jgi:hypothetical protein